eukprot:IDg9383t1
MYTSNLDSDLFGRMTMPLSRVPSKYRHIPWTILKCRTCGAAMWLAVIEVVYAMSGRVLQAIHSSKPTAERYD